MLGQSPARQLITAWERAATALGGFIVASPEMRFVYPAVNKDWANCGRSSRRRSARRTAHNLLASFIAA
ncbi:hypothetical protein ASE23_14435 [Rhizobium sp. Root73]|nr:hypothetical protein ASC96_20660 [Rhizobium sp. Root1204]KRB99370.1 hypothetical protein ASE23_14435 [Rhizobium sp. Root73]